MKPLSGKFRIGKPLIGALAGAAAPLIVFLATLSIAGPARAAVTVIGGGLAQTCSKSALAGASDAAAEAVCTTALETEFLSPRDLAGTYVNRGVMKLRRKLFAPALADFDLAVRAKPELGEIYVNRGAALIGQRRYADGLADLDHGLSLGVEEPAKAYYNRALAHEGLDDVKAAYLDYLKAVELAPDWDAPKRELTRFHVARKE